MRQSQKSFTSGTSKLHVNVRYVCIMRRRIHFVYIAIQYTVKMDVLENKRSLSLSLSLIILLHVFGLSMGTLLWVDGTFELSYHV